MLTIIEQDGNKFVAISELYSKLKLDRTNFTKFIQDQLIQNEYASEGKEFYYLGTKTTNKGGRPKPEYILTLSFAKDIIIRSKSKVGKIYRDWLVSLDTKVENKDLLTHDQVVYLSFLKGFFKYIDNQEQVEIKHKDTFAERSTSKSPYVEFNNYRNKMLNIEPAIIEQRLREYCIENKIGKIPKYSKRETIRTLDKYATIKNAVWDFLSIRGDINALKLADLVKRMAETENMMLYRSNDDNLFQNKEELPELKQLLLK